MRQGKLEQGKFACLPGKICFKHKSRVSGLKSEPSLTGERRLHLRPSNSPLTLHEQYARRFDGWTVPSAVTDVREHDERIRSLHGDGLDTISIATAMRDVLIGYMRPTESFVRKRLKALGLAPNRSSHRLPPPTRL